MAQPTKDQLKPTVAHIRTYSHGRGGAGNINAKPSVAIDTEDLSTPTLKTATYTTGRGGTGNMASNTDATLARAAQDVEAVASDENKEHKGTYHWGRGGEGNMMTVGHKETRDKSGERSKSGSGERRPSLQGLLEKGKEMLGLGKGKGEASAVIDE